jgi:hypothetical protein
VMQLVRTAEYRLATDRRLGPAGGHHRCGVGEPPGIGEAAGPLDGV